MKPAKVLVFGDDTRSFLAVVRSLGRKNIEVHAAPIDFMSPALSSVYIKQVHYIPFWTAGPAAWLEAVEKLLKAERYDLVVPCNETSLLPLQKNRARLGALAKLAIPDDAAINVFFDKYATRELAVSVGCHVLPGALASHTDDASSIFMQLGSPLVLKPRQSYSLDNLDARGRVRVLANPDALQRVITTLQPEQFFYEGYMCGRGIGISVLAHEGRITQAFEHHRVRENESGSYYRVSAALTPNLEECCAKMVAKLNYTGIAMFEFRVDDQMDKWALLEVNARPWGSLPLPVSIGVDFPYLWYQLLVNGTAATPARYPLGVYGRNLVLDLHSTLADVKATSILKFCFYKLLLSRFIELGRVLYGQERHDCFVWDDPRPGLLELNAEALQVCRRMYRATRLNRFPGFQSLARHRARSMLRRALQVNRSVSLIFVCQGNICRSPFAEAMLQGLGGPKLERVKISSAGMLPRPGRSTPEMGIEAAAALEVDLRLHRSSHLSREQAYGADLIVVFDEVNRQAVLRRYPGVADSIVKLNNYSLSNNIVNNIEDPIDKNFSVYLDTYNQITDAIKGFLKSLERYTSAH